MKPIPKNSDIYTIKDFIEMVKTGCFIDYDGYGYYATTTLVSDEVIRPSDISGKTDRFNEKTMKLEVVEVEKKLNKNYSHVVWYNR